MLAAKTGGKAEKSRKWGISAKVITAKSGLLVFSAYDGTGEMTGVSVTGVAPSMMGQDLSPSGFNNNGAAKIQVMLLYEAGFKSLCENRTASL